MRHFHSFVIALMLIGTLAYCALGAAVTPNDVYHALSSISLAHHDEIVRAFKLGFSLGRLVPSRTLSLVNRLVANRGNPADKDGILLTIARALEDDLPVTLLFDKTEEGLARNVPLGVILNGSSGEVRILGLIQREAALESVSNLLLGHIFRTTGKDHTGAASLPRARFDRIVTEIADVLCDYVVAGGSPVNGYIIYQKVQTRLENMSKLKQPTILPGDAALVLKQIKLDVDDLSKICENLYKMLG